MAAYYNEFDPYAAQWLRNLIDAGHLAPGVVDERSILDVQPDDLLEFDQCHFFAGIGVWPYALRRVGWPDDKPIWSGSCPCQPFSAAGVQLGFADERHLWPAWFHLITQRRPAVVVGEQVASALGWLDLVSNDLEGAGYTFGAADLCAAGYPVESWFESPQHEWLLRAVRDCPDPVVAGQLFDFAAWAGGNLGAHDGDHIRQRLYFVGLADAAMRRREPRAGNGGICRPDPGPEKPAEQRGALLATGGLADADGEQRAQGLQPVPPRPAERVGSDGVAVGMGDADDPRPQEHGGPGDVHFRQPDGPDTRRPGEHAGVLGGLADADGERRGEGRRDARGDRNPAREGADDRAGDARAGSGAYAPDEHRGAADWLFCRDGKWRPVRPGTFPLANATAGRVGKLRAYGNALDAQTVVEFLTAVRECTP